jgi:hypothetical protein
VFCVEDRAILCPDCDDPIHSANDLTAKHTRFLLVGAKLSAALVDQAPPSPDDDDDDVAEPDAVPAACAAKASSLESGGGSSISDYLTNICPGWRVDDLLLDDSSFSAPSVRARPSVLAVLYSVSILCPQPDRANGSVSRWFSEAEDRLQRRPRSGAVRGCRPLRRGGQRPARQARRRRSAGLRQGPGLRCGRPDAGVRDGEDLEQRQRRVRGAGAPAAAAGQEGAAGAGANFLVLLSCTVSVRPGRTVCVLVVTSVTAVCELAYIILTASG